MTKAQVLTGYNQDNELVGQLVKAKVHLDFVVSLYREQIDGGRLLIHEHPLHAASWMEKSIRELMHMPGVSRTHGDQCQYGAEVRRGKHRGLPVKKPTGWPSNSQKVLAEFERNLQGYETDVQPKGRRQAQDM